MPGGREGLILGAGGVDGIHITFGRRDAPTVASALRPRPESIVGCTTGDEILLVKGIKFNQTCQPKPSKYILPLIHPKVLSLGEGRIIFVLVKSDKVAQRHHPDRAARRASIIVSKG